MHQLWSLLVDAQESTDSSAILPLDYPDGRVLAAFFLGSVFASGSQHIIRSSFIQRVFGRVGSFFKAPRLRGSAASRDLETLFTNGRAEKPWRNASRPSLPLEKTKNGSALVFTLNLSLVFAALAMLLSIFNYAELKGSETLCAFVIAWGGMAARLTRLIGFIIIITDLGWTGINIVETWSLWAMLSIALAFNFAFNATNTGSTSHLANSDAVYCYRRQFLATALASSITHFVIELYLLARVFWVRIPRRARLRERLLGSKWFSIARICSLLVFDALTVVPDAISTNVFAQFIPFSVGALVVLMAFNYKTPPVQSPMPSMIVNSKPESDLLAPTPFTLHFDSEQTGEPVAPHDWSTVSLGPHPSTSSRRPSHIATSQTGSSTSLALTPGIEEAVIAKASTAWRRSVKKLHLMIPFPHSAPAVFGTFASSSTSKPPESEPGYPHKIVPSQVEFAARLEREDSQKSKTREPLRGLTMPPLSLHPSHGSIESDASSHCSTVQATTPGSAVYGSDIIQITSGNRRADRAALLSPASASTFFAPDPHRSTRRSSAPSWRTDHTASSSSSAHEHERAHAPSAPASRRTSLLPPDAGAAPSPRRARAHYSFSSVRSRRDELPTVRELPPTAYDPAALALALGANANTNTRRSLRSRRTTFGDGSFAVRRVKREAVTDLVVPAPAPVPSLVPTPMSVAVSVSVVAPTPPVPAHLPARPRSGSEAGPPPNVRLLPATPERGADAAADLFASPATSPRSWQGGKVRGPRPPPSAVSPSSGWPVLTQEQELASMSPVASRRRSSLPLLFSHDPMRTRPDGRRPSA